MGSVKNLEVLEKPTEGRFGSGVFEFTDDYSVFDYGKMPDTIPNKGESLCRMASWNFEAITRELGVKTHFRRFLEPNRMEVSLVRVLFPGRDVITTETRNYLIPLEIIVRNSLPPGSSVFRALNRGELTIQDLGLDHRPEPGEKLETPILDVTTKLETSDRRLKWDEARSMSGLTEGELEQVKGTALGINEFLTKKARSMGLEHADGKFEMALGPGRELLVVDVFGTLDENRFLSNNFHISKQVLRDYYKKTPWYGQLDSAKAAKPREEWPAPSPLPPELVSGVSDMYKSVCDSWTGSNLWNLSLDRAIGAVRKFL